MDASRKHDRHVSFEAPTPPSPSSGMRPVSMIDNGESDPVELPKPPVCNPGLIKDSGTISTSNSSSSNSAGLGSDPGNVSITGTKPLSPPSRPTSHIRRPVLQRFYSLPNAPSPSPGRHHFRLPSAHPHEVVETPRIQVTQDAQGMQFVNQYRLVKEVGRGSYGMVYAGQDPSMGTLYAIKKCSKLRLAKLNRHVLMQQRRHMRQGGAADVIRREVAIMKKLDHPNLVSLYEVLDDERSDSLFLVIEWCGNGAIMPPESEYNGKAVPLGEEQCRLYFRDIILGVEYLHAKGVCHRDIKADNVLLGDNDVVKLADFGVSEIFDVASDQECDNVRRCVGSPAYMAPELVRLNRGFVTTKVLGAVSGRKTDIWAMGVTLYYMLHGHLPFEATNMADLLERIVSEDLKIDPSLSPALRELLASLLEKNPDQRIRMPELRNHSWVTNNGTDMLLSTEENVQGASGKDVSDAITDEDLVSAIETLHLDLGSVQELTRTLRVDYGWRGGLNSHESTADLTTTAISGQSRGSPAASSDPQASSQFSSPESSVSSLSTASSSKMEKLTRALDEIARLRWWANDPDPKCANPDANSITAPNAEISAARGKGVMAAPNSSKSNHSHDSLEIESKGHPDASASTNASSNTPAKSL